MRTSKHFELSRSFAPWTKYCVIHQLSLSESSQVLQFVQYHSQLFSYYQHGKYSPNPYSWFEAWIIKHILKPTSHEDNTRCNCILHNDDEANNNSSSSSTTIILIVQIMPCLPTQHLHHQHQHQPTE